MNVDKLSNEREEPKYLKKKGSSLSKSKEKSKHKHTYTDCVLVNPNGHMNKAAYCTICGKITDVLFFMTEPCEYGHRVLDQDEVMEKCKGLPRFNVDDIWQKYVTLVKDE